jgi:protein SCO1/2
MKGRLATRQLQFRAACKMLSRRDMLVRITAILASLAVPAIRIHAETWHNVDVSDSLPPLAFTMTRATDRKKVNEADYKGKVVLLYFGYTYCPDVCPTTLTNVDQVLAALGSLAAQVKVLFVTVDPNRDDLSTLRTYTGSFGPQVDGIRGTPDELAGLARRFRVSYSAKPATKDHPYEVTHSSAIYVFDATGDARLLLPSLSSNDPDIDGTAADLRHLVASAQSPGWLAWLRQII